MPDCFPEGNEATISSDTRRSWIKMASIGATPSGDSLLELGDDVSFLDLGDGSSFLDLG